MTPTTPHRDAAAPSAAIHDLARARAARMPDVLRRLWQTWSRLGGAGGVPWRADVTPDLLGDLLPHAMLLDHVRPGTTRVDAAGATWAALLGTETRGLPARAFFDLAHRTHADAVLAQAFDGPATVDIGLAGDGPEGLVEGRMIVLPLRGDGGVANKALAGLWTPWPVAAAPTRFEIRRHAATRLAAPRHAAPRPVAAGRPLLSVVG